MEHLAGLEFLVDRADLEIGNDLALHRAQRETLDKRALRIERERERRGYGQHDCRGDLSILNAGGSDKGERADRDRLFVGGRQNERKDEVVPAEDESQEPGGGDPRTRQRNRDARERAPPRMTGNAIGVFNVRGQVLKIAAHDPENKRQRDQLIDPDEADVSVGEPQLLEIKRERQQHQQRRREAERHQGECDILTETELEARERIRRGNAKNERNHNRRRREKDAVPEIFHKCDVERSRRRNELAGDQGRVVGERRREEKAGRDTKDVLIGLERHKEDPEDRKQEEEHDEDDQDAPHHALQKRHMLHSRLLLREPAGAFAQFQPLFDEDVRQGVSDRPQDDQQRSRLANVRVLIEFEIGADLEDKQRVSGSTLSHRIDDVELLDRIEHPEQRSRDDVGRQHRQRDAKEDEAPRNTV